MDAPLRPVCHIQRTIVIITNLIINVIITIVIITNVIITIGL